MKRIIAALLPVLVLIALPAAPALAHKGHKRGDEVAKTVAKAPATAGAAAPVVSASDRAEATPSGPPLGFAEHLFEWLGRFHPMLVHFPLAFIPAALFTAVVGRKRPGFAKPVRFLVLAGGLTAPAAALAGWLDGGFALDSDDWILQSHRWIGTGIGLGALLLAIRSLRRPAREPSPLTIAGLSVLTLSVLVQGWFGGALVHGVDHLNW